MSVAGNRRAIVTALLANLGITIAKFVGFVVTGSSSMLAEAVHSVADTANQGLLLLGQKTASRRPTPEHPFGYGRDRYFYSFVVALLLFSLGAVFATYEGIHKISDPKPLDSPLVAVLILLVAFSLEGFSFRTAIGEARLIKGDTSWWRFVRNAKAPELPVVLLEDFGALVGLGLAFCGVTLTMVTGNPLWDGVGTVCIGALLGGIAALLIVETKSLLIGEGTSDQVLKAIVGELEAAGAERVIHIRTQYLGPDELLVAAKIALNGSLTVADAARVINEAEQRVRARVPTVHLIYLEPDLDRAA